MEALHAGNEGLEAEIAELRRRNRDLDDELARMRDTKLFRWSTPARRAYARLRGWQAPGRSEQEHAEAPPDAPLDPIAAFEALYRPSDEGDLPTEAFRESVVRQFHRLYYYASRETWRETRYRGVVAYKCPLDLWIYQELLHQVRPGLIIETGTAHGGSAYFLADVCSALDTGRVVSIDIEAQSGRPAHDRVTYLTGSSTDPEIVARVRDLLPGGAPVLAILDSDHSCAHVLAELETYGPMVTQGSYLVVEDTNVNDHPILPHFGAGPMEAVQQFLDGRTDFVVDTSCEKFMVTFNPSGYLRRTSPS